MPLDRRVSNFEIGVTGEMHIGRAAQTWRHELFSEIGFPLFRSVHGIPMFPVGVQSLYERA